MSGFLPLWGQSVYRQTLAIREAERGRCGNHAKIRRSYLSPLSLLYVEDFVVVRGGQLCLSLTTDPNLKAERGAGLTYGPLAAWRKSLPRAASRTPLVGGPFDAVNTAAP